MVLPCQERLCASVIPALRRLRRDNFEFEASLNYRETLSHKNQQRIGYWPCHTLLFTNFLCFLITYTVKALHWLVWNSSLPFKHHLPTTSLLPHLFSPGAHNSNWMLFLEHSMHFYASEKFLMIFVSDFTFISLAYLENSCSSFRNQHKQCLPRKSLS
jgi:hypothetical protein